VRGHDLREPVVVEALVGLHLTHAEPAADVHLDQRVTGVPDLPRHRRDPLDGHLEPTEIAREEPVPRVHVHRVHAQAVLGDDRQRLVQLLGKMPNFVGFAPA
jgi:hypothetical protein